MRKGLLAGLALLTACAGHPAAPAVQLGALGQPLLVTVELTAQGCAVSATRIGSGPTTFSSSNTDDVGVNEVSLVRDGVVVAEDETVAPGLTGSFTLDLAAGEYTVVCPRANHASAQQVALSVVDVARPPLTGAALVRADALAAAVTGYRAYLDDQTAALVTATEPFEQAVLGGDLAQARALYPTARVAYERIEPVAEAFPDLDGAIDARLDDVADPAAWTGFHYLENRIFTDGSLDGTADYARLLLFDVNALRARVLTIPLQPASLANGAKTLLDEVGRTKVTGEEERYSHVDLVDFQANVDGARAAFDLLAPVLADELAATIRTRFQTLDDALTARRTGPGAADFVTYDQVDAAGRKALSADVDALAEALSQVAAQAV